MTKSIAKDLPTRGNGPIRWGREDPPVSRRTIPAANYSDPDRFALEREVVRRSWQLACHVSELAEPGDTVLFEAYDETVAIVRQPDGTVKAWHNVCQHRGTRLVCEPVRGAKRFVCPYHFWVYGLDGALTGVPGRKHFDPGRLSALSTPQVAVEERLGWIWVNLSPDPRPLGEMLAEIDGELAPFDLAEAKLLAPVKEFLVPSNWKRGLEAFIEIYHASMLHKDSIPEGSVDCAGTSYRLFERNSMMVYPMSETVVQLERTLDHQRYASMQCMVFPNINFNLTPTAFQVYDFLPVSVDQTRMRLWVLSGPSVEYSPQEARAVCDYVDTVFGEDIFICGEQARTAKSSGIKEVILGDEECRITHFFATLDRDIAELAGPERHDRLPQAKSE